MSKSSGGKAGERSRPLPHWVHTVGVEAALGTVERGAEKVAEYLGSRPYKLFPGTNVIQAQPLRWGVTRWVGGVGRFLGTKAFGKIPIIGPIIDLFTPSKTIMPGAEEKRLLRQEKELSKARLPKVEQGIQYEDGAVYFPKSREWIFPATEITRSKPERRERAKSRRLGGANSRPKSTRASNQSALKEAVRRLGEGLFAKPTLAQQGETQRFLSNVQRQLSQGILGRKEPGLRVGPQPSYQDPLKQAVRRLGEGSFATPSLAQQGETQRFLSNVQRQLSQGILGRKEPGLRVGPQPSYQDPLKQAVRRLGEGPFAAPTLGQQRETQRFLSNVQQQLNRARPLPPIRPFQGPM